MSGDLEIRAMRRDELEMAIGWAAAEGWNPGLHDADAYYASDPQGFLVGLQDGEPVGSVSAVKYAPDYAFMGFFIVKPELRGGLLGPRLAEAGFRHVGDAVAGLDGVLEQAGHYAALWGFEPAYHNMRYEGVTGAEGAKHPKVAPFTLADLAEIERYDRTCFPAARRAFLERWLQQPGAHPLIYRDGNVIKGYGMIRPARKGYRIGPLFADDRGVAEALFGALTSRVPAGSAVYIDVPQPNEAARALVTDRGMTPVFETARMYRGGIPEIAIDKVFGVTTLELG